MSRPAGKPANDPESLYAALRSTERLSRIGFLMTVLMPTWFALVVPLPDGQDGVWWPRLACAATVSLHLYGQHRLILRRTLPARQRMRRRIDIYVLVAVLVTVSPVGEWLAGLWSGLPGPVALGLPLLFTVVVGMSNLRPLMWTQSGGGKALAACLSGLLLFPARILCADGIPALLIAGFRHPDRSLSLAACGIAVIALIMWACRTAAEHDIYGALADAHALRRTPGVIAEAEVRHWVRQRAVGRTGGIDTSLILGLTTVAQSAVMFSDLNGRMPIRVRHPLTLDQSERLLHLARMALDTLDEMRTPDGGGQPSADRDVLFARAMVHQVSATLAQRLHEREDAASHYFAAADHYAEAEMTNSAALCRIWGHVELGAAFFVPADALEGLEAVRDDERLVRIVRRLAGTIAEIMRAVRDHGPDGRVNLRRQAKQVVREDYTGDVRVLCAEAPDGIPQLMTRSTQNVLTESLRMLDEMATHGVILKQGTGEGYGGMARAVRRTDDLLEGAKNSAAAGREEHARYLAVRAQAEALRYGDFMAYTTASDFVMDLELEGQRWSALYQEMTDAAEVAELARQQTLEPQRKSAATFTQQQRYAAIVALLLEGWQDVDWPPPDAEARALEVVERSRSRALLDVLGETLTIPVSGELEPLARRERKALDELRSRRAALVSIGGTAAEDADALAGVRRAEYRLRAVQDEIEATGDAGAEYLQLRRGTPIGFPEIRALLREASGMDQPGASSR
ncbi:hypothetical protein [Streptomyces sp. NPDC046862]|uniref:hypothetical protein n=1 Tax=Streptomyces sp. NPDC046862 TaxID=3154603 RepID=UPI0034565C1F